MRTTRLILATLAIASASVMAAQTAPAPGTATYQVEQTVTLSGIPDGTHTVKWWIAIPGDNSDQEVLDLAATIPGKWSIVREADHGNRFLFTEVKAPAPALVASN